MQKYHYVYGVFQSWLVAWVKLASALVGIVTFGFIIPDWDTEVSAQFLLNWFAKRSS